MKEVCILVTNNCNNGQSFEEAPGASTTRVPILPNWMSEFSHGTKMADIVKQINPNANLILIRNAVVTKTGAINIGGAAEFVKSLDWVINNAKKYNISAVSFSRGKHTWTANKMVVCNGDLAVKMQMQVLQSMGVATIIAAGNDGDKVNVDYPACTPEAVAISGIYSQNYTPSIFSTYRETLGTNSGESTDFYAMGNFNTIAGPVAESTSASTAAFAGYWSKMWDGNFQSTYNKIASQARQKFVNVLQ